MAEFFLGLDFGTSGARTAVLDATGQLVIESRAAYADPANPWHWREALFDLIGGLPEEIRKDLSALSIDGTSGTLLATDPHFEPVSSALPYNDGRAATEAAEIAKVYSPLIKGVARSVGGFVLLDALLKETPCTK